MLQQAISPQETHPLFETENELTIKMAISNEESQSVFTLGYYAFLNNGLIKKEAKEWLIQNFDFDPETVILIVQDKQKNIVASATLVFDGTNKLPSEKKFGQELKNIRREGNKTAELTRLLINPSYQNPDTMMKLLFNYATKYIQHVKSYDGLVIQASSQDIYLYKSLLNYQKIAKENPLPHIQSAPNVLFYLPAKHLPAEFNHREKLQFSA